MVSKEIFGNQLGNWFIHMTRINVDAEALSEGGFRTESIKQQIAGWLARSTQIPPSPLSRLGRFLSQCNAAGSRTGVKTGRSEYRIIDKDMLNPRNMLRCKCFPAIFASLPSLDFNTCFATKRPMSYAFLRVKRCRYSIDRSYPHRFWTVGTSFEKGNIKTFAFIFSLVCG